MEVDKRVDNRSQVKKIETFILNLNGLKKRSTKDFEKYLSRKSKIHASIYVQFELKFKCPRS